MYSRPILCVPVVVHLTLISLPLPVAAQEPLSHDQLIALLDGGEPRALEQAAAAIQKATPKSREELLAVAASVKSALSTTRDAKAEAALRLALGKLAAAGVEDAAEWGFESMSVTHRPATPPEVFAAHVAALEMVKGAATELMLGNLDVAINLPITEPKERQRLKEFVTLTAEGMQTRELADFLDALLSGEEDLFVKIEAPLEIRLLNCYRNVKADPPINADAAILWLENHPGGPPEVELAALEVLTHVGTTKAELLDKFIQRLLAKPAIAVAIANRLSAGRLPRTFLAQVKRSLEEHAQKNPSPSVSAALQLLTNDR